MKKISNTKKLLAGMTAAALASCLVAGCAQQPSQESGQEFEDQVEQVSVDMAAYPNHVSASDGTDTLAGFHMALGYTCETCHTGDLAAEIEIAGIDGEPELSSLFYTDTETCLGSGCHSWENLAESAADLGEYNPHASIHGTIEYCNDCHKAHSPQIDTCGECHPNGGQEMLF